MATIPPVNLLSTPDEEAAQGGDYGAWAYIYGEQQRPAPPQQQPAYTAGAPSGQTGAAVQPQAYTQGTPSGIPGSPLYGPVPPAQPPVPGSPLGYEEFYKQQAAAEQQQAVYQAIQGVSDRLPDYSTPYINAIIQGEVYDPTAQQAIQSAYGDWQNEQRTLNSVAMQEAAGYQQLQEEQYNQGVAEAMRAIVAQVASLSPEVLARHGPPTLGPVQTGPEWAQAQAYGLVQARLAEMERFGYSREDALYSLVNGTTNLLPGPVEIGTAKSQTEDIGLGGFLKAVRGEEIGPLVPVQQAVGQGVGAAGEAIGAGVGGLIGGLANPTITAPLFGGGQQPGGYTRGAETGGQIGQALGQMAGEAIVPTYTGEVLAELLPGIGTVPGVASWAGTKLATAGVLRQNPRLASIGAALLKATNSGSPSLLKLAQITSQGIPGMAGAADELADVGRLRAELAAILRGEVTPASMADEVLNQSEWAQQLREGSGVGMETQELPWSVLGRAQADITSVERMDLVRAVERLGGAPQGNKRALLNQLDELVQEWRGAIGLSGPRTDVPTGLGGTQRGLMEGPLFEAGAPPAGIRPSTPIVGKEATELLTRLNQARRSGPPKGGLGEAWQRFLANPLEEIGNLQRQSAAGADASYILRQGGGPNLRHVSAITDAARAAVRSLDDAYALAHMQTLRRTNRPGLWLSDLSIEDVGAAAGKAARRTVSRREEQFASNAVEAIPGIGKIYQKTGQFNTTYLNTLRASRYDRTVKAWERTEGLTGWLNNVLKRDGDLEALGNYVTRATGRGTLGPLEDTWVSDILGTGFFSPRYQASRPQALLNMFNLKHPRVAIEAIKDFTVSYGATIGLLALANESGLADVNLDPTSSDFGKFRVGPTRIDPWAGYQQLATFTARLVAGEIEGTERSRWSMLERFLRSKLAPFPGSVYSLVLKDGEDMLGRKLTLADLAAAWGPIYLQGVREGIQEGLLGETLAAIPAEFFGLGAQTYRSTSEETASLIEQDLTSGALKQKTYLDADGNEQPVTEYWQLSPLEKEAFDQRHPENKEDRAEFQTETTARIRELQATARQQQQVDDDSLLETNPAEWRRLSADRNSRLQAAIAERAEDYPETEFENRTLLDVTNDEYQQAIEDSTGANGAVDWEAVDRVVAGMSPEQQALLFEQRLAHETAARKQYYHDLAELEEYFQVRDQVWQEIALSDPELSEFPSFDAWVQDLTVQYREGGLTWAEARSKAQSIADRLSEKMSKAALYYLADNLDLLKILDEYDYYVPSKLRKYARPAA